MTTIVFLATAWGSKYGGINVVNLELTRALAEVLGPTGRVLCVVPHAEPTETTDAKAAGVTLVALGLPPEKLPDYFDMGWVGSAEKALEALGVRTVDWCVGHDVISGAAANVMKRNGSASSSAVISHMSYADYQGVKHDSFADAEKKSEEQGEILNGANVVLAVGPLLRDRASNMIDRDVTMIVPGLSDIESRPARKQLVALSFGRFEATNDRVKQIRLVAEGLAEACKRESGGSSMLNDIPQLKLIGVSKNEQEMRDLRAIMKERAGRIINLRPLPYQEDRQKLFHEIAGSNLALMLSWHEGFGLTGWEAIAAEVPLIVSKQTGLYQFLHENDLHLLVHGLDVDGSFGDDETPNFGDGDRTRVAATIRHIVDNLQAAQKSAKLLKSQLLLGGWTWQHAARKVLEVFGITVPTPPPSEGGFTPTKPDVEAVSNGQSEPKAIAVEAILETKELTWEGHLDPPDTVLLRAEYRIVPFHKLREPVLDALIVWANLPEPAVSFRLHVGAGGSGKTRLAIELCRKLRAQGWQEGFLRARADSGCLAEAINKAEQSLVVVDYAETRASDIHSLVQVALSMPKGHRLRVLMLARNSGDWWYRLANTAPETRVSDILRSPTYTIGPYPLPKLELSHDQRAAVFNEALQAYAGRFNKRPEAITPPPLTSEHFAEPLFVHLAALCALRGDRLESARDLLDATVAHERAYWKRAAAIESIPESHMDGIEQVAALATLAGGARHAEESRRIVRAAPRLRGLNAQDHDRIFDLLRQLYPLEGGIDAIYPDLVGEWVVLRALEHDEGVLEAALQPETPESWARSTFAVLTRVAQREPKAEAHLRNALRSERLTRYASIAMDIAIAVGDPLAHVLSEMLKNATPALRLKIVEVLREKLPKKTVALQELAITIAESWAATRRKISGNRKKQIEFTEAYSELAFRLGEAGQTQRELETMRQCVESWRVIDEPESLAGGLNNLSIALSQLGFYEQALNYARETEAIFGAIALRTPNDPSPHWAMSLNTLSLRLKSMGHYRESISHLEHAETIYWQLSARSDEYVGHRGRMFMNLAAAEIHANMPEEALKHAQMATQTLAKLATTQPDAHYPDWAQALTTLSFCQQDVGQFNDAHNSANHAEKIFRQLAEARPDAYRAQWATALASVALTNSALGEHGEALQYIIKAKEICRELATQSPNGHGSDLARTLQTYSALQSHFGQHNDAIVSAREAEEVMREIVRDRPEIDQSPWLSALNNLASQLSYAGQHSIALEYATMAKQTYEKLVVSQPELPESHLANSCLILSEILLATNEPSEALRFAKACIAIVDDLFARYPRSYALGRGLAKVAFANALAAECHWKESGDTAAAAIKQFESFSTYPDAIEGTILSLDILASALEHCGEPEHARLAAERALHMVQREREKRPQALGILLQRVSKTLEMLTATAGVAALPAGPPLESSIVD